MVSIILSIMASLFSGVVLYFVKRYFDKKAKKDEIRDNTKREENILILKTLDSVGKLTYANAIAIRDGKTNGELKEALRSYHETYEELYDFLLKQNANK